MKRKILNRSHFSEKMNNLLQYEGETIEEKVRRLTTTNEPVSDGVNLIYTEKKDGVRPEFNIRTDKWEIAQNAMTKAAKQEIAKGKSVEGTDMEKKDDNTETPAEQ